MITGTHRLLLVLLAGLVLVCASPTAAGANTDVSGQGRGDTVFLAAVRDTAARQGEAAAVPNQSSQNEPAFVEYRWVIACTSPDAGLTAGTQLDCGAARVCAESAERLWRLWGRTPRPSTWRPLTSRCFDEEPTAADTPQPTVTRGLVLNALRRVGLPGLEAHTQPEGKTLVNFDTIFYTNAESFTTNLRLLGQDVDVEATPSRFLWHHGDGTTSATSEPGSPYPAKDITYRYTDAHVTVEPRVDVTYTARFRVNGGAWRDIAETITITGPRGELRVAEATPALSGNYE